MNQVDPLSQLAALDSLLNEYSTGVDAGLYPDVPLDLALPELNTDVPGLPSLDKPRLPITKPHKL